MTEISPSLRRALLGGAPALGLVVSLVGFGIAVPGFLSLDNLESILTQSSWLVVVALGVNFALLAAGVDLSVGAMMYLVAVVVGMGVAHAPIPLVLMAAAATGALFGSVNALFIVHWRVPPFIATLATAFVGRGLGLYLSSTKMVFAGDAVSELGRAVWVVPAPLWIAAGMLTLAWILLDLTPFGVRLVAVGADAEAARRVGIPVRSTVFLAFCASGLFAGVGGLISFSQTSAASAAFGEGSEFLATAAAVLGGTSLMGGRGSVLAPIIGAVLIITIQKGLVMIDANPYSTPLITGGVIFAAALLDAVRRRLGEGAARVARSHG